MLFLFRYHKKLITFMSNSSWEEDSSDSWKPEEAYSSSGSWKLSLSLFLIIIISGSESSSRSDPSTTRMASPGILTFNSMLTSGSDRTFNVLFFQSLAQAVSCLCVLGGSWPFRSLLPSGKLEHLSTSWDLWWSATRMWWKVIPPLLGCRSLKSGLC